MQSENPLNINLTRATEASQSLDIELDGHFFADLEQEEISDGKVNVHLDIRAMTDGIFTINISAEGVVTVACDRCLDPLELEVKTEEQVRLKHSEAEESDAPDMIYADTGSATYDLSWIVYEIIETSLPLQRVHPHGKCNPDVEKYILQDNSADDTDGKKEI